MATRAVAILWLVVGALLWNAVFDLYVSRGVREYLQLRAEAEHVDRPAPSMADVMTRATRTGVVAASLWAVVIVAGGWLTIAVAGWSVRRQQPPGRAISASQKGPTSV